MFWLNMLKLLLNHSDNTMRRKHVFFAYLSRHSFRRPCSVSMSGYLPNSRLNSMPYSTVLSRPSRLNCYRHTPRRHSYSDRTALPEDEPTTSIRGVSITCRLYKPA